MEDEGRESTEQHAERTYTRKGIFAYDYATKKTENISSGDITDYTVDEVSQTLYYYVFNDGLYKRKLSDNKAERINTASARLISPCSKDSERIIR